MSSRFKTIPGKIHERIYMFYSEDTTLNLICNFEIVDDVLKPADVSLGRKKAVSLMRVCKQTHSEILVNLAKFNTIHVPALHQLSSITPLPKSLPVAVAVAATLRSLHITTSIDRLEPQHANHIAFPCLREITFMQDPSEPMPIPANKLSRRVGFPYYPSGYFVHEADNPRTMAKINSVVQARCATLARIFQAALLLKMSSPKQHRRRHPRRCPLRPLQGARKPHQRAH